MAPATRREALNITIDTSLSSKRVIRELNQLMEWRGKPEKIRVDNGPRDGRRNSLLK
jgi:putative transposase